LDSIEIPLFEDRCAVQVTLTQVLRHVVNKTIDKSRASLILYGLQLALQTVDRSNWAIPIGTVQDVTQTSDGEDLVADPDDEDEDEEDEDEYDDEDQDDDDDDEDEEDPDQSDAESDDDPESDSAEDDEDEGERSEGDADNEDEDEDDEDCDGRPSMEDLIADLEYLDSVRRQAGLDSDPSPLLPALRAHVSARGSAPPVPPSLAADPNPPAPRTPNPCPAPCAAQPSFAPPNSSFGNGQVGSNKTQVGATNPGSPTTGLGRWGGSIRERQPSQTL
jgi:hypothetical protein